MAFKSMCDLKNLKVHWTADIMAFDEALEGNYQNIERLPPHVLTATNLVTGPSELANRLSSDIAREIQAADPARPLGKSANGSALCSVSRTSWETWSIGPVTCWK